MSFSVVYGARGGTWTLTSKRQILSLVRLPIPPPSQVFLFYIIMVPLIGVEPITYWLQVSCSTRWAKAAYMVVREGFEPSKAEPSDLQSDPFGRSGTSPLVPRRGIEPLFIEWKSIVLTTERTGQNFFGWGGWIRTNAWRSQSPLPYRLATPHNGRNSKIRTCGPLLPRQVRYRTALYSDLFSFASTFAADKNNSTIIFK